MSIDISLYIKTGEHSAEVCEVGNYTHNCQPMWSLALNSTKQMEGVEPIRAWWNGDELRLCGFDNITAADALDTLTAAVAHMDDPANEAQYVALNPDNGWGKFESAREYLRRLRDACAEHYLATIHVSC